MPRPKLCRKVRFNPKALFFKPQGVPMAELEMVEINREEMETIRLKDVLGMDQVEAAKKMNTSQSTFQRILSLTRKKISTAIVEGKAIKIED